MRDKIYKLLDTIIMGFHSAAKIIIFVGGFIMFMLWTTISIAVLKGVEPSEISYPVNDIVNNNWFMPYIFVACFIGLILGYAVKLVKWYRKYLTEQDKQSVRAWEVIRKIFIGG